MIVAQRLNVGFGVDEEQVPKGRLTPSGSAVPSGLTLTGHTFPKAEALGYCRKSLRDEDIAIFLA